MLPRSNIWDSFNFALAMGYDKYARKYMYVHVADDSGHDNYTVLVQLGQAELANYSYSELSYVSAKLYRSSVD